MDFLPIRRALLSVTHKDGLAEFATAKLGLINKDGLRSAVKTIL